VNSNLIKTQSVIGRKSVEHFPDNTIKDATPGKCDPKIVCISNPLTATIYSSNQIVFPACINVNRCEGCCPSNEKCVAIKVEIVKLKNVIIFEPFL
jgi:hypothetical protein